MIMRRFLWILPALLLLASSTPNAPAHVITYTISFTGAGAPTVVGSDLISYSFAEGCFTSPASIVLSYQGNNYTLALGSPDSQMPVNPDLDKFGWGASLLSNGGMEIYIVDLAGPSKIYLYQGGPLPPKPGGSGGVVLTETKS
jgi:hypothetical protein